MSLTPKKIRRESVRCWRCRRRRCFHCDKHRPVTTQTQQHHYLQPPSDSAVRKRQWLMRAEDDKFVFSPVQTTMSWWAFEAENSEMSILKKQPQLTTMVYIIDFYHHLSERGKTFPTDAKNSAFLEQWLLYLYVYILEESWLNQLRREWDVSHISFPYGWRKTWSR